MSERYSKEWIERLLDGARFEGVDPRDVLAAHGIGERTHHCRLRLRPRVPDAGGG